MARPYPNQTDLALTIRTAQKSRQAARRLSCANLSQVLDTPDDSTTNLTFAEKHNPALRRRAFDLRTTEGNERALIAGLHPGDSAIGLAFEALSQYNIPAQIKLRFNRMDRKAGRAGHAITDGTIFVDAELTPTTGMKSYFTIPIVVRASKMLYPSLIVTAGGNPRIIAQSTMDELLGYATVEQTVETDRRQFDSGGQPNDSNTRWSSKFRAAKRMSREDIEAVRRAMRLR